MRSLILPLLISHSNKTQNPDDVLAAALDDTLNLEEAQQAADYNDLQLALEDDEAIPTVLFEDAEAADDTESRDETTSDMSLDEDFPDHSMLIKHNRVKELDSLVIRVALGLFYTTLSISRLEY